MESEEGERGVGRRRSEVEELGECLSDGNETFGGV